MRSVDYDLCVLTGDYRAKTHGPIDATLSAMARLRTHINAPIYGVLGNHDSICMVPALEAMGVQMLLNESTIVRRGDASLHLAGIDLLAHRRVRLVGQAHGDAVHFGELAIQLGRRGGAGP